MAQEITVNAELRTESGSTAARRLRRAGSIPAVLSRTDGASELLKLDSHEFERMLSRHAGAQLVVTVVCGGKNTKALLREIQRDGLTGRVTHADFGEIDERHKMHVQIPVVLVGIPDGVANFGGVLDQVRHEIEVSCLPSDIMEKIEVDVSGLGIGSDITVGDIKLDDRYVIVTHADQVIATVEEPAKEEEPATEDTASADAVAQPELSVKKGSKDKDGGGAQS